MEVKVEDDLRAPLLDPVATVAVNGAYTTQSGDKKIKSVAFKISGIKSASCSNSIESMLGKLSGVEAVMMSPLEGKTVVKYLPDLITAKSIKETIEDMGFQVDEISEHAIAVCRIRIKGMACTSCSESTERALLMIDGVKKAAVGLALEEAKVHFDPNVTNIDHIIEAVEDAGFGADIITSGNDVNKVHLQLEGISKPDDMTLVQSSLESLEGVNLVEVNLEDHKVIISYDPDITGPRSLIQCIRNAGGGACSYNASLYTPQRRRDTERQHEIGMYRNQFLWSCSFSVPVFLFSMILPMLPVKILIILLYLFIYFNYFSVFLFEK